MRHTARVLFVSLPAFMAVPILLLSGNPPAAARDLDAPLPCADRPDCPTPTPQTAFITITTPSQAKLPADSRAFEVAGTARGLTDAQIVVRARDRGHRIIDEQVAVVEGSADGEGAWRTTLHPQPDLFFQDLTIEATAGDAKNGIAAQDFVSLDFYRGPLVEPLPDPHILQEELNRRNRAELANRCQEHVTWPAYTVQAGDSIAALAAQTGATERQVRRANCLRVLVQPASGTLLRVPRLPGTPPAAPTLLIDAPLSNGVLIPNAYFPVSGTLANAMTGTLAVRAVDALGRVLAETIAEVTPRPAQPGPQRWRAKLVVPDVTSGTRAQIYAYWVTPDAPAIGAADAVPVIFGTNEPDAYLAIDAPLPYAQIDANAVVTVRGRGKYEGPVIVEAVDSATDCTDAGDALYLAPTWRVPARKVLASVPAQDDGVDAYGEQRWHAKLSVAGAQRARICVYNLVRYGGPRYVPAGVDVRFVDPGGTQLATRIDFPLPETVFTNRDEALHVQGIAPAPAQFLVQDAVGRVLHMAPVVPEPASGVWRDNVPLPPIADDGMLSLQVIGAAAPGHLPESDRLRVRTSATDALLTGVVSYTFAAESPDPVIVRVFIDKVVAGSEPSNATLLAQQRIEVDGSQPVAAFAVRYSSAAIDPNASYALSARIENGSYIVFGISDQPVAVITQGAPTRDVEIVVRPFMGYAGRLARVGVTSLDP
ncbi:MAG: YbaY family lipoprotein [Caldilinea sp.]|nr:YbaY family lipoprotein [Caldilineaceae bacterium]MCB9123784.1 YbaY family lipoprotein [Caldilineaceae bacterium]MCO5208109.1 YbaY family lipoprotein [Caldilinea sp.]